MQKSAYLFIIACLVLLPRQTHAHCTWRHPGHCVKGAVVIATTPATAPVDLARQKKIGTTAKKLADEGSKIVKGASNEFADLGKATEDYLEAVLKSVPKGAKNFERRLREDRFADAFLGLSGDNFKAQQKAAAAAAQRSDIVNAVGSTAATAYGGPGGAAAYTAWSTYNQTGGDIDAALKAGAIAGLTSAGMTTVSAIPTESISLKKAIAGGAIGGMAVAASGGDERDVLKGFLAGGGMIIVQDGYKAYVGSPLDSRASSSEPAYCMATIGAECSPPDAAYVRNADGSYKLDRDSNRIVDVRKTNLRVTHVGTAADRANPSPLDERSNLMIAVSKVPGVNAMSVMHDSWVIDFDMTRLTNQATILPAIVVTYVGTGSPLHRKVISENTKKKKSQVVTNWSRASMERDRSGSNPRVSYGNESRIGVDVFVCADTNENKELALLLFNSFATMDLGRVRLRHGNIYGEKLDSGISIIADSNHPEIGDAIRLREILIKQFKDRRIELVSNSEKATSWYLSVGVCST
jgi:hypothetical protein